MMTLSAEQIKSRKYRGKSTVDRFWEKVVGRGGGGCWMWKGCIGTFGYGFMHIGNDTWPAHRVSWVIHFGDIPKGLFVLHTCDIRNCVNPNHLWLGTYYDNLHDAMRKGRWVAANGERVGTSKLVKEQVAKIRDLFSTGRFSKVELARRFNVTDVMVGNIVRRRWWRHI